MFNRWLFRLTTLLALLLFLLTLAAPALAGTDLLAVPRWLALFAGDMVVRRTAIGCAVGLFITALVFFRGPRDPAASEPPDEEPPPPRRPRSTNTIGA